MEEYLAKIDPIVKNAIKKFRHKISGHSYEDLLQEGRLAAFEALQKWRLYGRSRNSNILYWAKIYIEFQFKNLIEISSMSEVLMEDVKVEIDRYEVEAYMRNSLLVNDEDQEDEGQSAESDTVTFLLQSVSKKYAPVMHMLIKNNLSQSSIGNIMEKSRARINQIQRDVMKDFIKQYEPMDDSNAAKPSGAAS